MLCLEITTLYPHWPCWGKLFQSLHRNIMEYLWKYGGNSHLTLLGSGNTCSFNSFVLSICCRTLQVFTRKPLYPPLALFCLAKQSVVSVSSHEVVISNPHKPSLPLIQFEFVFIENILLDFYFFFQMRSHQY